ncbi:hypothetical protein KY333_05140 [Candidatus Woesearchaeota archaeon]|nr:hypothetical protein [Candidatus Woesearchaeota archaeon]
MFKQTAKKLADFPTVKKLLVLKTEHHLRVARKYINKSEKTRAELNGYYVTGWDDKLQHKYLSKARKYLNKAIKQASKAKFGSISPLAEAYQLRASIPTHTVTYAPDSFLRPGSFEDAVFESTFDADIANEEKALGAKPSLAREISEKTETKALRMLYSGVFKPKELDVLVNRVADSYDLHVLEERIIGYSYEKKLGEYQLKQIKQNLYDKSVVLKGNKPEEKKEAA